MHLLDKLLVTILIIVLGLWFYIGINKNSYSEPLYKKAKVIEFIVDKDKGKFETVLEIDGEIIFKNDKDFYYKGKRKKFDI